MDMDTIQFLRDLLLKGDSERALVILNAEIRNEEEPEDDGSANEALGDKHLNALNGDDT